MCIYVNSLIGVLLKITFLGDMVTIKKAFMFYYYIPFIFLTWLLQYGDINTNNLGEIIAVWVHK